MVFHSMIHLPDGEPCQTTIERLKCLTNIIEIGEKTYAREKNKL